VAFSVIKGFAAFTAGLKYIVQYSFKIIGDENAIGGYGNLVKIALFADAQRQQAVLTFIPKGKLHFIAVPLYSR
jgi:hypothetical protein